MNGAPAREPALWRRILRSPLTRLILLGGPLVVMMAVSDDLMKHFKAAPLKSIAAAAGMAALATA